jgi:hypothetical protein
MARRPPVEERSEPTNHTPTAELLLRWVDRLFAR